MKCVPTARPFLRAPFSRPPKRISMPATSLLLKSFALYQLLISLRPHDQHMPESLKPSPNSRIKLTKLAQQQMCRCEAAETIQKLQMVLEVCACSGLFRQIEQTFWGNLCACEGVTKSMRWLSSLNRLSSAAAGARSPCKQAGLAERDSAQLSNCQIMGFINGIPSPNFFHGHELHGSIVLQCLWHFTCLRLNRARHVARRVIPSTDCCSS